MNTSRKKSQNTSGKGISKRYPHTSYTFAEFEMTPLMHLISISSLLIQFLLTAFAVYAANTQPVILPLQDTGISSGFLFFALPLITWMLTLGFRIACRMIPLELWRLPADVKKGMLLNKGTLLKFTTLLLELETAICFVYIGISLYLGYEPNNLVLLIWIIFLILSVYLPCKKAGEIKENRN